MEMSLLEPNRGLFEHTVRDCIRQEQWSELAYRRAVYYEIRSGVDRSASSVLYNKLPGLQLHRLRCIQTGAIASMERLSRGRRSQNSPACPCCGYEEESVEHIFDHCPAHADARAESLLPEYWATLPDCLRLAGLMPLHMAMPADIPQTEDGRKQLACQTQYTLLSILESRARYIGAAPAPRWQRRVRPRVEVDGVSAPGARRTHALDAAGDWQRDVRPRLDES